MSDDPPRVRPCREPMLVPSDGWIGEWATDYGWGGDPPVGCNHLRCGACGEEVRQRPGLTLRGNLAPELMFATATESWHELPGVSESWTRLYACKCRIESIAAEVSVLSERWEDNFSPIWWRCVGHPPLELPLRLEPGGPTLDGVQSAVAAVAFLLGPEAAAATPKPMRSDQAFPLNRVLRGLWTHVEVAEALSRAVAGLVDSADAKVQSRALRYFVDSPSFPGSDRIVELLQARPDVFVRPDPFAADDDLLNKATRVLLRQIIWPAGAGKPVDVALLDKAKALALAQPQTAMTLVYAFWDHDRGWLYDHAPQLVAGHAPLAAKLFMQPKTGDVDELRRWAQRLAAVPVVRGDKEFWRLVKKYLPKAEAQALAARC